MKNKTKKKCQTKDKSTNTRPSLQKTWIEFTPLNINFPSVEFAAYGNSPIVKKEKDSKKKVKP